MTTNRKGFTLIEILIVVAIIAILASIVLVGLGPTQQSGRDARRLSDLHEIQNALELYYNKCGYYPGTISSGACASGAPTAWSDLSSALQSVSGGTIPVDPSSNRGYGYNVASDNSTYVIGAVLENGNNSVFNGYTPPTVPGSSWIISGGTAGTTAPNACPAGGPTYCLSL